MLASAAETHQLSAWGRDQGDKLYNYTRSEREGRREHKLTGREQRRRRVRGVRGLRKGLERGERERGREG